jgi:hypothetical protein
MKQIAIMTAGAVLVLASLWLGSYALEFLPSWTNFAALMTAAFCFMGGGLMIAYSAAILGL